MFQKIDVAVDGMLSLVQKAFEIGSLYVIVEQSQGKQQEPNDYRNAHCHQKSDCIDQSFDEISHAVF